MVILGVIILSFGICLAVTADVIMNSGEAFVKAISDTIKKEFGIVKTFIDVTLVIIALILSVVFFNFKIIGVREGTLIVALCTGLVVKLFMNIFKNKIKRWWKI